MERSSDRILARVVRELELLTDAQLEAAWRRGAAETPALPLDLVVAETRLLSHAQVLRLLVEHGEEFRAVDARHDERVRAWQDVEAALRRGEIDFERAQAALRAVERSLQADSADGATAVAVGVPPARPPSGTEATIVDHRGSDPERTVVDPATEPTAHAGAVRASPRRLGNYELHEVLGRGGMGIVYRARHPGLGIDCAVKVLIAGNAAGAELLLRFRREAQAAARLHHSGIVTVHDVGEHDGTTWMAMEYVEGSGLDRVIGEHPQGMTVDEALGRMAELADAVQHAHAHGVIHRDLKPANVLCDRAGRMKITDFGLAKVVDAGAEGGTRAGQLIGTPAYMAPEQAQGRSADIDARTDIYQLGAILYEMLTGRRPYQGASAMDVVFQVAREGPPAPRNVRPELPRDVETICRKAMARDRQDRYESASALAEDCRRQLRGDSILARLPGPAERVWRWSARHPWVAGLLSLLVLLTTVALATRARSETLRRQLLEDLRLLAKVQLDGALAVRRAGGRIGDTEAQFLPALRQAIERAEVRAPGLAEPRYHLGRLLRALQQPAEALAEQNRALALDPAFAPALYERAVLRAQALPLRLKDLRAEAQRRRIAEELAGAGVAAGGGVTTLPTDEQLVAADSIALGLKSGIVRDLEELERQALAAPDRRPVPEALLCARGLYLLHTGAGSAAREAEGLLQQALEANPLLEEARTGLAQVWSSRGDFAATLKLLDAGIEIDRGMAVFYLLRCEAQMSLGRVLLSRGDNPDPQFAAGIEDAGRYMALGPPAADGALVRGMAWASRAGARVQRGEDPTDEFTRALADCDLAVQADPDRADCWLHRSTLRLQWGLCRILAGAPGHDLLLQAQLDIAEAMKHGADPIEVAAYLGYLQWCRAQYGTLAADESSRLYRDAARELGRVVQARPGDDAARLTLANALQSWGTHESGGGGDFAAVYERAIAETQTVLGRDPEHIQARVLSAGIHAAWGDAAALRGGDPTAQWRTSEQEFTQALALRSGEAAAWCGRGQVRRSLALHGVRPASKQAEDLGPALADFLKAVELDPGHRMANFLLSGTLLQRAIAVAQSGQDPTAEYRRAIDGYTRALERFPGESYPWAGRGESRRALAAVLQARGEDGLGMIAEALADFDRALECAPGDAYSLLQRGQARLAAAGILEDRGSTDAASWAAAEQDLAAATSALPNQHEAWLALANARFGIARARAAAGEDPVPQLTAAAADARTALARVPEWSEGWNRLGWIEQTWALRLSNRGGGDAVPRFAAAREAWDHADRVQPKQVDLTVRRGLLCLFQAEFEARRGIDPRPALAAGHALLRGVVEEFPLQGVAWYGIGWSRLQTALWLESRGLDGAEALGEAEAALTNLTRLAPQRGEPWAARGTLRACAAGAELDRGRDPEPGVRRALEDLDRALTLQPGAVAALLARGGLKVQWGSEMLRRGSDPATIWDEALADLTAAAQADPLNATAWFWRARLHDFRGVRVRRAGGDPAPEWQQGRDDVNRALAANPDLADAWRERARVQWLEAGLRKTRGEDPRPGLEQALSDLDRADALNPLAAETSWVRARICEALGRTADALESRTRATRLRSNAEAVFGQIPE